MRSSRSSKVAPEPDASPTSAVQRGVRAKLLLHLDEVRCLCDSVLNKNDSSDLGADVRLVRLP